jgi:hypothetical protein
MDSNGSALLEEDASPPASRQRRNLFFRSPEEPEGPSPSPAVEITPPATSEDLGGSASEPGWPSDEPTDRSESDPTSSRGSSGNPLAKLGKATAQKSAAKAVLIAGGMAHRIAARTEAQQAAGLYLADEEDARNIGDPIGSLVARRGGVAGKAVSPDVADLIEALMGLANYISKQLSKMLLVRDYELQQQPAGDVDAQ